MSQINETNIREAIENTNYYQSLSGTDKFKQKLIISRMNVKNIFIYYQQGNKFGYDYLTQNPSIRNCHLELLKELLTKN